MIVIGGGGREEMRRPAWQREGHGTWSVCLSVSLLPRFLRLRDTNGFSATLASFIKWQFS